MAIRLLESGEVIIHANPGPVRPYLTQLTSLLMGDLEIVAAKISPSDVIRNGKKLRQITITFDAAILEPSETMSWTK